MSTMFHIYGDESISNNTVVYGLVVIPVGKIEFSEETLCKIKEKFKSCKTSKFHCREVFHRDVRKKSVWSHLSDKESFDLSLDIVGSLAGNDFRTIIGCIDRSSVNHNIPGVAGLPGINIKDSKQLIPLAYQAAIGQILADKRYAGQCKLWVDSNNDLIGWFDSRKQIGRMLVGREIDFSGQVKTMISPEITGHEERPCLLDLADILAYSACRVLENRKIGKNRYSDRVIDAMYKAMNPMVSEPDSKLDYVNLGARLLRSMSRIEAMKAQASALAIVASKSLARRRHRPSQARVLSTTHLRGRTSKPFAVSERLMISTVQVPRLARASVSFSPAYPPSAKRWRNQG